jgi:2-C-methyl-D-erythritol 2,4-cyclodiphosphate synthase
MNDPIDIPFRVGHGYDIHRLQPGGRLMIGGVAVSDSVSAVAHSDGDVAIHALVDAILGAMGWGDIGQSFPNSDAKWKGVASRLFLESVCSRLAESGWAVSNADVTIMAERPTLNPYRQAMAAAISGITGGLVNVKAGTNEQCDAVGKGQAVAAHAVVLVAKRAERAR